ncbi:MAG TPA: hypothetical protein VE422_45850 [Terriglobia bacterium]|nr:hypothetical protein [Terriglobia bacterium]
MPRFLTAAPTPLHNSPPASGAGSRSEPLVHGRGSVQSVAAMRTDAYYRSPVNPNNPVVVWTDGARSFFSPAESQIIAGNINAAPEATFSPPAGYVPEEIHWDRVEGLTSGGGALVIIARKPGEPELDVAITNHLEQKFHFAALGVTAGASSQVAREGGEFVRVNDSTVPLEFSGARAPGDIHSQSFADGFFRYRAPGGDHDLYVAQGANPVVHLVERSTGSITRTFASGTIAAIVPDAAGIVHLETNTPGTRGTTTRSTVTIDLRSSPPDVTTATGHTSAESGYAGARSRVEALGVTLTENGLRLRVNELEMIELSLSLGGNQGLNALVRLRALNGGSSGTPILEVTKSIGPDNAYGMAEAGAGPPTLDIFYPFESSPTERTATVRHEMTHIIMGAIDAISHSRMTAKDRADLEGALRFEAGHAREMARAGLLRAGEYGAGDRPPSAGSRSEWRNRLGGDLELADIWVELLRRYSFLPDPEGTRELRGASLADESRYLGASETSGHPADSLGEFVASFVTSATLFRNRLVRDVLAAEVAGNAHGGAGGSYLRGLYRKAWNRIDAFYVPLGSNPF